LADEAGGLFIRVMAMTLPSWFQRVFHKLVDFVFAVYPQPQPGREQLRKSRIIAHRGIYDNQKVFENTLAAFDAVAGSGVWGLEFDVRWTKDRVPVVFHDRNLGRIFGADRDLNRLKLAEIKASFPLIPTLEETLLTYGRKLHLMVEIKAEPFSDPAYNREVLKDLLARLTPAVDYHVISLDPAMFKFFDFLPPNTFLPIAEINVPSMSDVALKRNYKGILGHYLMITDACLQKHRRNNQTVGTGFVNSANCFFREINRGVVWMFSDNALLLQNLRDKLLSA